MFKLYLDVKMIFEIARIQAHTIGINFKSCLYVLIMSRTRFRVNPHSSSKEFLDIQATIECGFTLKRVRGMKRTYSQHTDCLVKTGEDQH